MCYRQGMHEILAPVIFVMYGDQQSFLQFMEIEKNLDIELVLLIYNIIQSHLKCHCSETLMDLMNPSYLEADS